MKYLDSSAIDQIAGQRIGDGETFRFRCHAGLACFRRCCHNLNLFLYPYDVLRLKRHLGITSDQFIDQYVDIVLRDGQHFPEVLLRMAQQEGQPCIFLSAEGCRVYNDRPHTCRMFPIEQGILQDRAGRVTAVHFFRPPDFCQGPGEPHALTVEKYVQDQEADAYYRMNLQWGQVRSLIESHPWGHAGPEGGKAKMAFMAAYNLDRFRDFVFNSSFLKRYKIRPALVKKLQREDEALLQFGWEWIKVAVLGRPSPAFK